MAAQIALPIATFLILRIWLAGKLLLNVIAVDIVGHYANNCTHKANRSVNHLEPYFGSDASSHSSDKDSLKDQAEEE